MTDHSALQDAAFDIQSAAIESLKSSFGREPDILELSRALALALGEISGLLSATGVGNETINSITQLACARESCLA